MVLGAQKGPGGLRQRIAAAPDRFADAVLGEAAGSEEARLRQRLTVAGVIVQAPAAFVWVAIYFAIGEPLAAAIPLFYSVLSVVNIGILRLRGGHFFPFFLNSQMVMDLVLPWLLTLALGGFVRSSGVIIWSLVGPMGALMYTTPRRAAWWFAGFIVLVTVAAILDPLVRQPNDLPSLVHLTLFAMNILVPSMVAFGLLQHFVNQRDVAYRLLGKEQEKSERLLLNVLPPEIAAKLKDSGEVAAARFQSISVLFADIVDSTQLTVELQPEKMVEMLNEVFSYFDALAEKYGAEKIRTIGDNYMVAAGVPTARPDHARALAMMALEMNEYAVRRHASGSKLQFRIGMNSGPAVAGIVGQKKFHYDIWGDPVNIASRMESTGVPGRIQVARGAYELLKDSFVLEPRGVMEVKGKGSLETWFLIGPR